MASLPPNAQAKANVSLVIETMYSVAANPDQWEQIIDALGGEGTVPSADTAPTPPEPAPGQAGVLLIGPGGGAVGWNRAGEAIFQQRLGVIESRGVRFFNPSNHEALDQARDRLRGASGRQVIVKFAQSRDEAPQFAYVLAASDLPAGLASGVQRSPGGGEAAAAIVFPAVEATDRLWASLRESFGLTPAETRLAARLKDGLTLKDAADDLGVSLNTVRNQLRAVFDKIGLSRQSDLIRALTQLSSLAGSLDTAHSHGALGPAISATEAGAVKASPPLQFLTLSDGRRLAWRQYGAPDGRPVMIVHQGMGCSVTPRGTDALARDLGLRLLCPERPGAGRSDPLPGYTYDVVAQDMVQLADSLGLPQVQVAAFMAGAPFGLTLAARRPDRVSRLLLASARPSGEMAETPRDARHKVVLFRRRLLRNPWVADTLFALMRLQLNPRQVERLVRTAASAPSDAAYLDAHPGVLSFIVEYISESLAVSSRGIADEIRCAAATPRLDLAGLSMPIAVWHGADDPMTSLDDVTAWIGHGVTETRLFPDTGHFLPHKHWPEVLAWLAED